MVWGRLRTGETRGHLPELRMSATFCSPSLCAPPQISPALYLRSISLPSTPWHLLCLSFFLTSSLSPVPLTCPLCPPPPPHPVLPPLPPFLGVACKSLTWQASSPALPPAHTMLSVILPGNTARQVALETMERLRHWSRSGNGPGDGRWMLEDPPVLPSSRHHPPHSQRGLTEARYKFILHHLPVTSKTILGPLNFR